MNKNIKLVIISSVTIVLVLALAVLVIMKSIYNRDYTEQLQNAYGVVSLAYDKNVEINKNITPKIEDIVQYLEIDKKCESKIEANGCHSNLQTYQNIFGKKVTHSPNIADKGVDFEYLTKQGFFVKYVDLNTDCKSVYDARYNVCGILYLDINGKNLPNRYGYDTFAFLATKDELYPAGVSEIENDLGVSNCIGADYQYDNQGLACSAWVILNSNTDYLECPGNLTWSGRTRCSKRR